jgi:hypothetical protein
MWHVFFTTADEQGDIKIKVTNVIQNNFVFIQFIVGKWGPKTQKLSQVFCTSSVWDSVRPLKYASIGKSFRVCFLAGTMRLGTGFMTLTGKVK